NEGVSGRVHHPRSERLERSYPTGFEASCRAHWKRRGAPGPGPGCGNDRSARSEDRGFDPPLGSPLTRLAGIESKQGDINMEDVISQAKADFLRAKQLISRALATTPDDRINWSPSPSARTPIQQVAHAARAVNSINGFLDGR